ncbi:hypothetical protein [Thiothrix subterranea]|uniref:hypothetical protein n=1 Tax=Thiothrix subterranea TaxID=2735563 RepID=UPI00403FD3EF
MKELTLAYHSLSETDLDTTFNTGSLVAPDQLTLREIIAQLEATYCGSIGVQYMHTTSTEQKRWVQQRLESVRSTPTFSPAEKLEILDRLTAAEGLERYLHTNYVGQKRFSLEGGESLIPMLNTLIQHGGSLGAQEMVIGMAHRGRLNVLVNVLGKAPALLFGEFEGKYANNGDRTGDVKYHMGFASDMMTPAGRCTSPWHSTPRIWKSLARWCKVRFVPAKTVGMMPVATKLFRWYCTGMRHSRGRA